MLKIALKSLLGHKLRMLLTMTSIVIGVSFVAGTYVFTDSMRSTFDGIFDQVYSSIDLTVRPKSDSSGLGAPTSSSTLPQELLEKIKAIEGIKVIEPEIIGNAHIIDKDNNVVGSQGAPSRGFSWISTKSLNPLIIKDGDGRPPQKAGEVVIDTNTAETQNVHIGDKVRILTNFPVEDFTIVGLSSFGEAKTLAGATITAFSYQEAQRLFGITDGFSQVSMKAIDGVSPDQLKEKVDKILPSSVESVTGDQQRQESTDKLNQGLGFITTALLAFAGVSVFVGSFIIQNTFRIIVAQRSKELALFRAVGATRKQVVKMVVYEAMIIAAFSSAIGIVVGVGISYALRGISNALGFGLPTGSLTLQPRTIAVAFSVGIVITALSALLPAIKASRVSPVEAMNDNEQVATQKSLKNRSLIGAVVSALGVALIIVGLLVHISNAVAYVGVGAAVVFLGVSIAAPLFTSPLANLMGFFILKRYGVIGRIARENTKKTPRRTASTAAALMIGVSLVVFVSIFASSVKLTVNQVIADYFPGDLTVISKLSQTNPIGATFPGAVVDEIAALPEVDLISRIKYDFASVEGKKQIIAAIEPASFNKVITIHPLDDSYDKLGLNDVYVKDDVLEKLDKNIGDSIEFEFAKTGVKKITVTGTFKDTFDSPYMISEQTYFENYDNTQDLYAVANIDKSIDFQKGKEAVNKVLERYPIVQSQDKDELVAQTRQQIDQLLGLMGALLGFAVIIAVLGITNTLTLSVTERTREIGMLRAIGMTRAQVRKMIRAEAIIIAVFGAILGVITGAFFGWVIIRALRETGFTSFSIPTLQVTVYLIVSAFAGVFAAIFPSYKASKMNILDAINYE